MDAETMIDFSAESVDQGSEPSSVSYYHFQYLEVLMILDYC